jgi:hypothetical protein
MIKFLTRRGKLEAKLKVELGKPIPNLEAILKHIDIYEKDNLDTINILKKEKIYVAKRINGALKSTINAHGPITKLLIGSASKRILGSLLSNEKPKKDNWFQKILKWLK